MGNGKSKREGSNGRLKELTQLLRAAEAGRLDGLDCPQCGNPGLSVWFSNPAKDHFRTWYVCTECTFHTRAQNSDKPAFFSTERCRPDLETRDKAILDAAKIKRPTR
jgi:hypothetical protein